MGSRRAAVPPWRWQPRAPSACDLARGGKDRRAQPKRQRRSSCDRTPGCTAARPATNFPSAAPFPEVGRLRNPLPLRAPLATSFSGTEMDSTSPAEGELEYTSRDDAVAQENGNKEMQKEVHPLAAFLAFHGITADEDDDDDDDYAESDDEWRPNVLCSNCTMPNREDEEHCGHCHESLVAHILEQPSLGGSSESTGADKEDAKSAAQEQQSSAGLLSKHLVFSGTFMSGEKRKTALGYDARMLNHEETGKVHPERPDRLRAIMGGLKASGLLSAGTFFVPPREATPAELELVHTANHISRVQATVENDLFYFTTDTYANKHSALAASLAAGICIDLASVIMTGKAHNGFAIVRPPGHHAETELVQGFCFHNNACVAARAAQAAGAKKVLIVDWDVHHGNGTQEIFEQDPSILYISLHRHERGKFYPGTGKAEQVGSGPGVGFCVNIPWGCGGIGDRDYLSAFEHIVMPIAHQFGPDITIISAGFDAARGDPLGGCDVTPQGYAQMTHLLSSLSAGRLLVVLEGGYNLRSISDSANAVMEVLQGANPGPLPDDLEPTAAGASALLDVVTAHRPYWPCLKDETLLKLSALLDNVTKGTGERKSPKRRHTGGPVWWKWGRKRLLYDIWLRGQMKHHPPSRHDDSCACC